MDDPAEGRRPDPSDPVGVLRTALATAVSRLADLDEQAPGAAVAGKRIATTLSETLSPVHGVLVDLVTAQPAGTVARTLGSLRTAVAHLEHGKLAAGRAAVLIAHVNMAAQLDAITTPDSSAPDWGL